MIEVLRLLGQAITWVLDHPVVRRIVLYIIGAAAAVFIIGRVFYPQVHKEIIHEREVTNTRVFDAGNLSVVVEGGSAILTFDAAGHLVSLSVSGTGYRLLLAQKSSTTRVEESQVAKDEQIKERGAPESPLNLGHSWGWEAGADVIFPGPAYQFSVGKKLFSLFGLTLGPEAVVQTNVGFLPVAAGIGLRGTF